MTRNFQLPGRSQAYGANGMVATSHPLATLTALNILQEGGNAVDAAIAACAVLAVVEPTQTGIGGDCFALLKRVGQPIVALNGSGASPMALSVEALNSKSVSSIEVGSPHSVTIPGAVGAWARLVSDYGTFDFGRLLRPAINAAETGYIVTERLARDWALQKEKMSRNQSAAAVFLSGGDTPQAGDKHVQSALAEALKSIAKEGPSAFYEGWIAQDAVETLRELGGFHALEDFAAYRPRYEAPISTAYRDFELWECAPNGSGVAALAMASLLNTYDVNALGLNSVERCHLLAEVARLAYAERDAFVGDPLVGEVRGDHKTWPSHSKNRQQVISMSGRIADVTPDSIPEHKDTVFLSVVDRDRTAISLINSIFDDFGSGIVAKKSGILFHNRGSGFTLEKNHPNELKGGKRPLHTILPAMLTRNGEVDLSFGVTGGHFQPIGQMQVISNMIDFGMSVQEAIDYPRIFARGDVFDYEARISPNIVADLVRLGHRPIVATAPLGTAQAIRIDWKRGIMEGGADFRRDGIALGY
ncbi:gamma-glutamyltransferase (plasmid) [Mesorhizobium sp. DCY119]|nr:gamma-glutamyltransferase [Mesorhizobium sp. DCY119]